MFLPLLKFKIQYGGRTRFTTTLQPALIKWLKIQAAQNNGSVADILENAINSYKYEKEKNL
jgi:hypothetical protein